MVEILERLMLAFIPLFVAIDPVGLIPLYLGMTESVDIDSRRRIARLATITAAIVAIGFVFLGQFIFTALGITVSDFQIAGGLILFILASSELLFPTKRNQAVPEDLRSRATRDAAHRWPCYLDDSVNRDRLRRNHICPDRSGPEPFTHLLLLHL